MKLKLNTSCPALYHLQHYEKGHCDRIGYIVFGAYERRHQILSNAVSVTEVIGQFAIGQFVAATVYSMSFVLDWIQPDPR